MSTTNILDMNNRIEELEKSYPANKVMMSDGVTSVEDALDGLTIHKITETQSGISYKNQLTALNTAYNALTDKQKQRAYIMSGNTKFIAISTNGQFMHHDAGSNGLTAITLNVVAHTAYSVTTSSITDISNNTNNNTITLYA